MTHLRVDKWDERHTRTPTPTPTPSKSDVPLLIIAGAIPVTAAIVGSGLVVRRKERAAA